jgi:hypothetical protein
MIQRDGLQVYGLYSEEQRQYLRVWAHIQNLITNT